MEVKIGIKEYTNVCEKHGIGEEYQKYIIDMLIGKLPLNLSGEAITVLAHFADIEDDTDEDEFFEVDFNQPATTARKQ